MADSNFQKTPLSWRRSIMITVVPFLLLGATDLLYSQRGKKDSSLAHQLKVPVHPDRVYLLGNSMFKTGIDLQTLRKLLPEGVGADMAYHDGHYTNLWYLVVKNAIVPQRQAPRILVWGYRPTYAVLPAFRRNEACDIERFQKGKDVLYDSIVGGTRLSRSSRFHLWLSGVSPLYQDRQSLREQMSTSLRNVGFSVLRWASAQNNYASQERDNTASVADLLIRTLTHGRVQRAEEQVVDAGKDQFITGKKARFQDSFIPVTARLLKNRGIQQLVILFKPASATEKKLPTDVRTFHEESVRFFKKEKIPTLNLVDDADVLRAHFAKGDHYNEAGRNLVTRRLGAQLNRLLHGQ